MSTDLRGLVAFLRARLDEDEQAAQAAFSGQADPENGWGADRPDGQRYSTIVPHVGMIHEAVQADHIVRWNPARVLRGVERDRRIIELHHPVELPDEMADACAACEVTGAYPEYPCDTLRLLALPYVDHPDYREEWRP